MDMSTILPLLQAHAWLALALVVIPQLDKMIAAGEWPFSLAVPVKYRFVLITIGGGAVSVLESIHGGSIWYSALLSGVLVVAFTLMKNGAGLFGKLSPQLKDAPPPDMPGVIAKLASKAPPPMAGILFGFALAASVTAPVVLPGCAFWKAHEPQVVHAVDTGCQVVRMLSADPVSGSICVALVDLGKLADILTAAYGKGEGVTLRYTLADGSFRDVKLSHADVTYALGEVSDAKMRAGLK